MFRQRICKFREINYFISCCGNNLAILVRQKQDRQFLPRKNLFKSVTYRSQGDHGASFVFSVRTARGYITAAVSPSDVVVRTRVNAVDLRISDFNKKS